MATKRTKPEAPVAKAGKPAPKRKVAVGPPNPEASATDSVATPILKAMTPPAPKANIQTTRKPAGVKAVSRVEQTPVTNRPEITTDVIALRAYFLAQRRQECGLPGDSTTDWLEAEQQLRAETGA